MNTGLKIIIGLLIVIPLAIWAGSSFNAWTNQQFGGIQTSVSSSMNYLNGDNAIQAMQNGQ
jgi:hypothetical protein